MKSQVNRSSMIIATKEIESIMYVNYKHHSIYRGALQINDSFVTDVTYKNGLYPKEKQVSTFDNQRYQDRRHTYS